VIAFACIYLKYPLNNMILWGFSLGTGPTIELASRNQNIIKFVIFLMVNIVYLK